MENIVWKWVDFGFLHLKVDRHIVHHWLYKIHTTEWDWEVYGKVTEWQVLFHSSSHLQCSSFNNLSSIWFIGSAIFHWVHPASNLPCSSFNQLSSHFHPVSSISFIQPAIFHSIHSASNLILFIQIVNVHPVDWMKEILCKSPSKKITEKYTYSDKVWWYTPEHRHVCSDRECLTLTYSHCISRVQR